MVRLLTAAKAEAIEADVDPAVAARVDAVLDARTAFSQSPTSLIWYELIEKHVLSKTTTVTKLAIQLQNAQAERWDAQAFKDQVWQACLDNNKAFLRSLSEASYFLAKGKPPPLDTTGTALEAYRELWLVLRTCPTPGDVKKRVEQKLRRTIAPSQWYETLREIRQLFE